MHFKVATTFLKENWFSIFWTNLKDGNFFLSSFTRGQQLQSKPSRREFQQQVQIHYKIKFFSFIHSQQIHICRFEKKVKWGIPKNAFHGFGISCIWYLISKKFYNLAINQMSTLRLHIFLVLPSASHLNCYLKNSSLEFQMNQFWGCIQFEADPFVCRAQMSGWLAAVKGLIVIRVARIMIDISFVQRKTQSQDYTKSKTSGWGGAPRATLYFAHLLPHVIDIYENEKPKMERWQSGRFL